MMLKYYMHAISLLEWLLSKRGGSKNLFYLQVTKACIRKGQSDQELKIRRYLVEPHLAKIASIGKKNLLVGGSGCVFCFGVLYLRGLSLGCMSILMMILGAMSALKLAVGAALTLYFMYIQKSLPSPPGTETIRCWFSEGQKNLRAHSLARLSLSETAVADFDSFVVCSPVLWKTRGVQQHDLLWRFEESEEYFGVYQLIFTHFAPEHLAVFRCDYNFLKNVSLNEHTYEVSYQDIVLLKTEEESSSLLLPTGNKLTSSQHFAVAVASGNSIRLGSSSSELRQLLSEEGAAMAPRERVDQAIAALRTALRDRKLALTHSFNEL